MMTRRIRAIAFYLPQFYPCKENDEWWGPGFTEWTNVAKAKPTYIGHYQPHIPRDLGFYDLRIPDVREKQAKLAMEAGIEGFCYWHYWFAGRRLLDRVFTEVVKSGKPDYPFCLCWANHNWEDKTHGAQQKKMLMEQTYPGKHDYTEHFHTLLPAFKDKRYMKVENKCIFGIFDPAAIPDTKLFFDTWNSLAKENGLDGFYFFAYTYGKDGISENHHFYNCIVMDYMTDAYYDSRFPIMKNHWRSFVKKHLHIGYPRKYKFYCDFVRKSLQDQDKYVPCIIPGFDHTPRSGSMALCFSEESPHLFGKLCQDVKSIINKNNSLNNLLFIKAWNEWAEGNYLEPDLKWGKAYVEEMGKALKG